MMENKNLWLVVLFLALGLVSLFGFSQRGISATQMSPSKALIIGGVTDGALANPNLAPQPSGLWSLSGFNIFNSNSGNVGIGTQNPGAELEVADHSADNDARINLRANTSVFGQLGMSSSQMFADTKGKPFIFYTGGGQPTFTLNADGNVEFKETPNADNDLRLTVRSNTNWGQLGVSGSQTFIDSNNKPFIFYTAGNGAPQLQVASNGDVSIPGRLCLGPSNDCRAVWPSCAPAAARSAPSEVVKTVTTLPPQGAVYDTGTKVGIGVAEPSQKLEVNGGFRLNTALPRPNCEEATRGTFWFTKSGKGDSVSACTRSVAGDYVWQDLIK